MAIRLVVFDVSGTTVYDGGGAVRRALREALEAAGLSLREGSLERVMGLAKPIAIRTLLEGHGRDELLPQVDTIHAAFVSRIIRYYRDDPSVRAVDGAVQTFARLRDAGTMVALNTGFTRPVLDAVLARLGWDGPASPIDASITSDEVARGRPYPDMITALRQRLGGIPAREVAKVGDTAVDLQEGTMAGCGLVIGVLGGGHDRAMLGEQPHDALLNSVAELPALLDQRRLWPHATT